MTYISRLRGADLKYSADRQDPRPADYPLVGNGLRHSASSSPYSGAQ
jgi:hypothetical protein